MSRIYIFTGKGGVGKSSIAAAHAVKSAEEGIKTILVSTDMAHNLGDIFETQVGREPVEVIKNLDIYEIDPEYVMEQDFGEITRTLEKMLNNVEANSMEDFGMLPGMDELFSLLKIADLHQKGDYERIIVDCAPTGETLSLLKFPELLSWYIEKFFPIGKVALRLMAPISKRFFKIELPDKEAMSDIEKMYYKLYELQELLKNRDITSIRLVCMPEKMVVEETKRNFMYMNLYDFNVDGIYINRILPRHLKNEFFKEWLAIQKGYMQQLEEIFGMLPMYRIPWYGEEVKGLAGIEQICNEALADEAVFEAKIITERELFEKNEQGYLLAVSLPCADKEELELHQSGTDVIIRLGNFKRSIPLPNVLRTYHITTAKLENQSLRLQFEEEES